MKRGKLRAGVLRPIVFSLLGLALLLLTMFTRQLIDPGQTDSAWLRAHGTIMFDRPRALDTPLLLDQDARAFDGSAFSGVWSVLFFGFSHCADVCPATMVLLRDVDRELRASAQRGTPLRFYFVTVDPQRDTPEQLRPYITHFSPNFSALTGDFARLKRFARQLDVPLRKNVAEDGSYTVDHSANLVLIDPRGHYAGFMVPPLQKLDVLSVLRVLRGQG